MKPWLLARKLLGTLPVVAGAINGETPLFAERYIFQGVDISAPPITMHVLYQMLGGSRVHEGDTERHRMETRLHQSVLIPAGVATEWHYAGAVDYAIFYLPNDDTPAYRHLREIIAGIDAPLPFSDLLVGASARQLVAELERGRQADVRFLEHLAAVIVEQTTRVLATKNSKGIRPPHIQLTRLRAVLSYIDGHLADDLSTQQLAACAQVSVAHFHRLFQQAMGLPPHRYVLGKRLERAREQLLQTDLAIARIAADCGFSSQSHLTTSFRAAHALSPSEFRLRERGTVTRRGRPQR